MASESVSIVQNGVVRRIIVPSAAGKSATPVGEVAQIFGADLTPAMVASSSQARKHPANQFIGSHISASANVGARSLSPSLVQARNQLTNALAKQQSLPHDSSGVLGAWTPWTIQPSYQQLLSVVYKWQYQQQQ